MRLPGRVADRLLLLLGRPLDLVVDRELPVVDLEDEQVRDQLTTEGLTIESGSSVLIKI